MIRSRSKTSCLTGAAVLVLLGIMLFPAAAFSEENSALTVREKDGGSLASVNSFLRQAYRYTYKEDTPTVLIQLARVQTVSTSTAGIYTGVSTPGGYDYWQLPEETEKLGTGDCEDKAIWLYERLLEHSYTNVRLVVGKYQADKNVYHVWVNLYVTTPGKDGKVEQKVYILDPTMDSKAWDAKSFPAGYYLPLYSFYKNQRWAHSNPPS